MLSSLIFSISVSSTRCILGISGSGKEVDAFLVSAILARNRMLKYNTDRLPFSHDIDTKNYPLEEIKKGIAKAVLKNRVIVYSLSDDPIFIQICRKNKVSDLTSLSPGVRRGTLGTGRTCSHKVYLYFCLPQESFVYLA